MQLLWDKKNSQRKNELRNAVIDVERTLRELRDYRGNFNNARATKEIKKKTRLDAQRITEKRSEVYAGG